MTSIDQTTFEELKQLSGDEVLNELIEAFLDEAPKMLREMHTSLASVNVESFRRNAHSLKSNANTFGAEGLAALAKELETLARENKLAEVGNKLEALSKACEEVQTELKSRLK